MTPGLNHLIARQRIDDLTRPAERARLTLGSRPVDPGSCRGGLFGRLLGPRRLRVELRRAALRRCADNHLR